MSPAASLTAPLVMDRLRTETRDQHEATEAIPFSDAMVNRTLPLARYIEQLAAYAVVHRTLERHLRASTDPTIVAVWREDLAKLPLLERDLSYFEWSQREPATPAIDVAEAYAAELDKLAANDPVALLGHLYVLEGSTLGATILRTHIAAAYGLEDDGLAYYSPYGNAVMPHWREFKQRMNDAVTDPLAQDRLVEAACRAFDHIGEILRALSTDRGDA